MGSLRLLDGYSSHLFRLIIGVALVMPMVFAGPGASPTWTARVPRPSWVVETPLPEVTDELDGAKWGDTRFLLIDDQVRTSAHNEETFHHHARRVIAATGISAVSEVTIDFDPSYTRLRIHEIWIHRDGQRIDALEPTDLKVIQQERELDRQIYNGSLRVLALLPDVRVGDVVEWSWTLEGRNPAMGEHYTRWWSLGWSWPLARYRLRILTEQSRPLRLKHFNTDLRPETTEHAGYIEYQWEQENVPTRAYDDNRPSWSLMQPRVQVSDFDSWSEVASWAAKHYDPLVLKRERMPEALRRMIGDWEALNSKQERAEAALRFVQDEVRYLGIEIGPSGYVPHDPVLVYDRRFGDCKDKSLLLVSILRAMDIEAEVALVDTDWKHTIEELLPSATVFDHAIAVAHVEGNEIWMDATQSLQRGPLKLRAPPDYRRALVVSDASDSLSEIPLNILDEPTQEIVEEFVVQKDGSVALTVTTVSRGDKADADRHSFSSWARDDMTRSYLNFYTGRFPDVTVTEPASVEDDEEANVITVREHYRLPQFWREGKRKFDGWSIVDEIVNPTVRSRQAPLRVNHPSWVRQTVRVKGVGNLSLRPDHQRVRSAGVLFDYISTRSKDGFEVIWEMTSLADHVVPEEATTHIDALASIDNLLGYRVREESIGDPFPVSLSSGWVYVISFLILAGVVAIRANKRKVRKVHTFRPGESPETAMPGPLEDAIPSMRCPCGGHLDRADADPTPVRYEEKLLLAATLRCRSCSSEQTCYVAC